MKAAVRTGLALALVAIAAGCSTSSTEGVWVAREADQDWPLTVDSGTLACHTTGDEPALTFSADNVVYGLNSKALSYLNHAVPVESIQAGDCCRVG